MVKIYDTRSFRLAQQYEAHEKGVTSLAFEPNGFYFASVGRDCALKVWDLRKGLNFCTIEAHSNTVNSVKFYNNYTSLLTCGDDLSVKFWNINLPNEDKVDIKTNKERTVVFNRESEIDISESQKLYLETKRSEELSKAQLPIDGNLEKAFDQIIDQLNKLNFTVRLMDQRIASNEKEVLKLTKFVTKDIEERNQ